MNCRVNPPRKPAHLGWIGADWGFYCKQGGGVKIGLFDTGVDRNEGMARAHFPSEAIELEPCFDCPVDSDDPHGHGTAMAGIIAAPPKFRLSALNHPEGEWISDGVAGVAPAASILSLQVAEESGQVSLDALETACTLLEHQPSGSKVKVVLLPFDQSVWNLPLEVGRYVRSNKLTEEEAVLFRERLVPGLNGGAVAPSSRDANEVDDLVAERMKMMCEYHFAFRNVLTRLNATTKYVVIVPASDGFRQGECLDGLKPQVPWLGLDRVISVAATGEYLRDDTKTLAASNFGSETVDLAAPGQAIPTVTPMAPALISGTSAAAAIVAGAGALISERCGGDADRTCLALRNAARPSARLKVKHGLFDLAMIDWSSKALCGPLP